MTRNGLGSLAGLLAGILVSTAGAARDGADGEARSSLEIVRAAGGAAGAENTRAVFPTENSIRREVVVAEGQTLGWILRDQGVEDAEARSAAGALGRQVDLRRLAVGQEITIWLAPRPTGAIGYRLVGVALALPGGKAAVALRRFDDRFDASLATAAEADALLRSITVVVDDGTPGFMSRELSLAEGDGFDGLMIRNGATAEDARAASQLLAGRMDLRELPVGHKITAIFRRAGEDSRARLVGAALVSRDGAAHTVGVDGAGRWRFGPPAIDPVAPEDRPAAPHGSGEAAETEETEETEETAAAADSAAAVAPAEDSPRAALAEPGRTTVPGGGTFIGLVLGLGFDGGDAREAANAIGALYDLRKLPAGAAVKYARVAGADGEARLGAIGFDIDKTSRLEVFRLADGRLSAEVVEKNLRRAWRRVEGTVNSSLFVAATNAGAPSNVVMNLIQVFSFSVDFQRDIKPGDRFSLIYETLLDDDGRSLKSGALHFASLVLSGEERAVYRYPRADGRAGYFDGDGKNVRKALMRTPIDGARLTSEFGMRLHPILKYDRLHKGVDFGAPSGTPVYASGDGVIERAAEMGGYGRYVRIRHNSAYKTAYAHLRSFAPGLYPGKRVSQREVIGYVGSSGISTGPHLHYEVLYNGRQVNPLSVELPSGDPLDDTELAAFAPHRRQLDLLNRRLPLSAPVPFDVAAGGAPLDGPIRTAANR